MREVVLFSSGVGYFEHDGTVHGDAAAELRFKTAQINDVLKSLVLQDLDGGQVRAVTYPSQDPIAKTLRSFAVDLTANPPLADLLNQLRGARVTVTVNGEKTAGTDPGRGAAAGHGQGREGRRPDGLAAGAEPGQRRADRRSEPMDRVSAVKLDDPALQDELTKALTALAGARDQDKKPVQIHFAGAGDRRVRLGYVVETPVWKTSYRLILGPRGRPAARPRPGRRPTGSCRGGRSSRTRPTTTGTTCS